MPPCSSTAGSSSNGGLPLTDEQFDAAKLSVDPHCYECKVKYRDPRPKDLVMFLHAWKYSVRNGTMKMQNCHRRPFFNSPSFICLHRFGRTNGLN